MLLISDVILISILTLKRAFIRNLRFKTCKT